MPIYDYQCAACNHVFEVFAKMSDPPPEACEACGATELSKVLHPVAVHYKGSGFYSTDYGSKRSGAGGSDDSSGSSDTSSGESKPASGDAAKPSKDTGSAGGTGASSSGSGSGGDSSST